jgi:hypothetical protein
LHEVNRDAQTLAPRNDAKYFQQMQVAAGVLAKYPVSPQDWKGEAGTGGSGNHEAELQALRRRLIEQDMNLEEQARQNSDLREDLARVRTDAVKNTKKAHTSNSEQLKLDAANKELAEKL